ncbi:MAG: class I SAM-dependent methyltransferase, partial [Planctomycetota bacterium]
MDRHAVDASDTDASGVETSGVDASSVIASDVDASPEHPARRNTDQLAIGITGQAMRCWMQQHQPSVIRDVQSSAWTDWQRLSWNDDLRFRCNRTLMTTLLRDSVPVLAASGWRISAISEGRCKSVMPLSLSNSNQHHTHQAAMIALSADYTGGMALTTVLRGAPIYGVHTTERLGAVSMWLANLDTRYLAPSQGSLHAVCSVDEKKMRMARRRFFAGKRLSVDLNIVLRSGEVEVAHAVAKYFAVVADEDTIPLAGKSESSSAGSAHMIAALRGQSSYQTQDGQVIRVDRPHDLAAAGPAGQRMAARVRQTLPQLPAMIDARTRHVAATIHATVPRQVVMIAAGMDMLPLRFSSQDLCRRIRVFEIDLPEMLQQRRRVFESLKGRRMAFRYPIAADVCKQDFAAMLRQHHRFDPQAVTLFLIEGLS